MTDQNTHTQSLSNSSTEPAQPASSTTSSYGSNAKRGAFSFLRNSVIVRYPFRSFMGLAASFAAYKLYDHLLTKQLMRVRCREAAKYGDERLASATEPVRHVTVILNPVANKRKSRKLYEKWVEPLFNLAGMRVSVIETEEVGSAQKIMEIMSNCDCVAVVGGDGTVSEVLDGLYSRPDWQKVSALLPIALIPAGKLNTFARCLYEKHFDVRNQKELIIETAMSLVGGKTSNCNLIRLSPEINFHSFAACK